MKPKYNLFDRVIISGTITGLGDLVGDVIEVGEIDDFAYKERFYLVNALENTYSAFGNRYWVAEKFLSIMKPKPIIFSTVMVQAILEGRKTQTRRLVGKTKPYQVGDRLWVRESWKPHSWDGQGSWSIQYKDGSIHDKECLFGDNDECKESDFYLRLCDYLEKVGCEMNEDGDFIDVGRFIKFRPSIHMPYGAHRIELQVVDVRKECLQNISREDAIAEGIEPISKVSKTGFYRNYINIGYSTDPINSFYSLWESIHGEAGVKQESEVYVYTFKVVSK